MQFPGNYLKLQLPSGEIDFLPGPMLSEPGFTWETFEGRQIALQTCEEVILRKVRYRAAAFKARDVFDLAAVARRSDTAGSLLLEQASDRLPALLTAVRRHDANSLSKANVRAMRGFETLAATAALDVQQLIRDLLARAPRS